MPRIEIDIPDDVYDELSRSGLPVPELVENMVRSRAKVLENLGSLLQLLAAESERTRRNAAEAKAFLQRLRDAHSGQAS